MLLFVLSILPGIIILRWFYQQDKLEKEPAAVVARLFFVSAIITIPLAILFEVIIDLFSVAGILGLFISSFLSAALIEESLKLWMVKKYAFHKPFFNEVFDGIVYAVTASLGFATLENMLYVLFAGDGAISIAVMRAFTAVPGHALDGALLGYYIGLAKFAPTKEMSNKLIRKGLVIAILFHGLYDFFIFSGVLSPFILPLLIVQGRYVQVAIRNARMEQPSDELTLRMHDITGGLGFFDYIKVIVGFLLGTFSVLITIGFVIMVVEDNAFIYEDGSMEAMVFMVALFVIAFMLLKSVIKKHKALL